MEDQFLLRPPLPALVSVLIVAGVADLAMRNARILRPRPDRLDFSAAFLLTTAALCAAVNVLVSVGNVHLVMIVRVVGTVLAIVGLKACFRVAADTRTCRANVFGWWRQQEGAERWLALVIVLILLGYAAVAIAPATDSDSLDYHLGVPLDWLLHNGAYPRPDWANARLVGLGEMVNLLGLACGTDSLGAVFQFAGLIIAAIAVTAMGTNWRDRTFGAMLVVGCPAILSLLPSQKPELLPAAGLALAVVILVIREQNLPTLIEVFGAVAFAIACKYTFILSGTVLISAGLLMARRSGKLSTGILIAALALVVLAGPIWLRNIFFYRDPISPLLERFKVGGDPWLVGFAAFLRDCKGSGIAKAIRLPWDLTTTLSPGLISTVLGIGTLSFIAALKNRHTYVLLCSALAATVLIGALSQLAPRFFLEPYLWCASAAAASGKSRFKAALSWALAAQVVVVLMIVTLLVARIAPGALTPTLREAVMEHAGYQYALVEWANSVLPKDAVVLTRARSVALLREPFLIFGTVPHHNGTAAVAPDPGRLFKYAKPQFALVSSPLTQDDLTSGLGRCLGLRQYGPKPFTTATRNPVNDQIESWVIVRINSLHGNCGGSPKRDVRRSSLADTF